MKLLIGIDKSNLTINKWIILFVASGLISFVFSMWLSSVMWEDQYGGGHTKLAVQFYWLQFGFCWLLLSLFLLILSRQVDMPHQCGVLWCVIMIALLARVMVVFGTQPVLSDDIWRYIHDGAVFSDGANPYRMPPAGYSENNAPVPGVLDRINNRELNTIYQPTSQFVFAGLDRVWEALPVGLQQHDPNHDKVFRLGFVFFDMAIIGLILFQLRSMGRSAWWAVAYAWHPLTVSEVAGSGHQDVIGIAFLLLAMVWAGRLVKTGDGGASLTVEDAKSEGTLSRKRLLVAVGAGVAFGLAVGVKPLVLPIAGVLAWVLRRQPRLVAVSAAATVLTGTALYLPFVLMAGGLAGMIETTRTFVDTWAFNGSAYDLVSAYLVGKPWVDYLVIGVLLAVIVLSLSRRVTGREPDAMRTAGAFLFASLLVSSTVHPWYLLWALALIPMYFSPALWVFSLTVAASYAAHLYEGYRVPTWVVVLEYLPVYVVLGWGVWRHYNMKETWKRL